MRSYFVATLLVLIFTGVISPAQQPTSSQSSPPLSVSDIEHGLKAGVTNTRMAALVKQYGVDFEVTDAVEKELRAAGANGDLLLAVTRSSHPPVSSAAPTTGSHQGVITPNLSPGDSNSVLESNAEGRALAAKLVVAMGGEAKLATIKAVRVKGTGTSQTPQGEVHYQFKYVIVLPDRLYYEVQTDNGPVYMVTRPEGDFMVQPGQRVTNMSADSIKHYLIFIATQWKDPNVFFHAGGTEKIGDVAARVVDVNAGGVSSRLFINPQTGRVLKQTYRVGEQGQFEQKLVMDEWRTVDGFTFPFLWKVDTSSSTEYTELEINPIVDPKIFEKPFAPVPSSKGAQQSNSLNVGSDKTIRAPRLVSPTNGTIFDNFPRITTVRWQSVPGASSYVLQVEMGFEGAGADAGKFYWSDSWDEAAPGKVWLQRSTQDVSYQFEFPGANPGRWRVWAIDANGQEGEKSDWWILRYTR